MDSGRSKDGGRASLRTTVIIVGAGQNGLEIGARLKRLDVSVLVERNARVCDNWRDRYGALCLHDPVCESHISD